MIERITTSKGHIFKDDDSEIYNYEFEENENLYFKYEVKDDSGISDEFKEIGEIIHILSGKYMIDFTGMKHEDNQTICSLEFTIWQKKKK